MSESDSDSIVRKNLFIVNKPNFEEKELLDINTFTSLMYNNLKNRLSSNINGDIIEPEVKGNSNLYKK